MIERGGKVNAKQVDNVKAYTLTNEIISCVKETATLHTDEWIGYNRISKLYEHYIVNHGQGEYANGNIHTNIIEDFWLLLKRGILGIYHFTSKKHLQCYVDEFVFRYNTRKLGESGRINLLLANIEVITTYRGLICG